MGCFHSIKRVYGIGLLLLGLSLSTANAALVTVSLTGEGLLCPSGACSSVGTSSLSFAYDPALFSLSHEIAFPGGTGKLFSSPDIALSIHGGGKTYSAGALVGASIFDHPAANDQFSFIHERGNVLLQWNDFTSTSFTHPLPSDFSEVSALLAGQIRVNSNLALANAGFTLAGLNGDSNLSFVMRNATTDISVSQLSTVANDATIAYVPLPPATWLFGSALIAFSGYRRRKHDDS